MHPAGFETTITVIERPETHALHRAVTGFETCSFLSSVITNVSMSNFFVLVSPTMAIFQSKHVPYFVWWIKIENFLYLNWTHCTADCTGHKTGWIALIREKYKTSRGRYTTNWQVTGSIPDGAIGIFQWHNPSCRTMALVSTQPLTEMCTRCISWG